MNQKRKIRCIEIAKSLSVERTGRCLHFSFILRKNSILIISTNNYRSCHPETKFPKYKSKFVQGIYTPSLHSEIASIKSFINKFGHSDFSKMTIFNVRIGKKGQILNSRPCHNCEKILNSFNFKNIEYTI